MRYAIEIYADTCCPWCYVGKKNLDAAIGEFQAAHPDARFDLVWRPFLLNPTVPTAGGSGAAYEKKEYLAGVLTRRHGPSRAAGVLERLVQSGAARGIRFRWEGAVGSTRDSHKLVLLARRREAELAAQQRHQQHRMDSTTAAAAGGGAAAGSHYSHNHHRRHGSGHSDGSHDAMEAGNVGGVQDQLLDALYRGVFEEGRDISDRAWLVATAAAVPGLVDHPASGEGEVRAWLESDAAARLADAEAARARQVDGVEAVPCYVVQGRYRVGGCQEPAVFTRLFERLSREEGGWRCGVVTA